MANTYTQLFDFQSWKQTRPVSWSSQCLLCPAHSGHRWAPRFCPELRVCRWALHPTISRWTSIFGVNSILELMQWARRRKEGGVGLCLPNYSWWAWKNDLRNRSISRLLTGKHAFNVKYFTYKTTSMTFFQLYYFVLYTCKEQLVLSEEWLSRQLSLLQNRPGRVFRPESASSQNMVSKQKDEVEKNRKF